MKTSGHTILITGATRGIGRELARTFGQRDNRIIAVGRDASRLAEICDEVPNAWTISADLNVHDDIDRLVSFVENEVGHLSLLINNAGIQFNYNLVDNADAAELFTAEVETNLLAPVRLTTSLLPLLLRSDAEAAVVNMTSILALTPKESAPSYCASKAGFRFFSKTLRWNLDGSNVRVFEVLPSTVDTDMTAQIVGEKLGPAEIATALLNAMDADQYEVPVGLTGQLQELMKTSPEQAEEIVRLA